LLSQADGGTLFLDEIDELPAQTQVALLGVLQDRRFRALGSNEESASDFRLICASNQDLEKCIEQGKLRQDLYHRLAHLRIHLERLSARNVDIKALTEAFLETLVKEQELHVFSVSDNAYSHLEQHDWPGNVRELQAIMEGAAYRAHFNGRTEIRPDD